MYSYVLSFIHGGVCMLPKKRGTPREDRYRGPFYTAHPQRSSKKPSALSGVSSATMLHAQRRRSQRRGGGDI